MAEYSAVNSTTTALLANETFTGSFEEVGSHASVSVFGVTDQNCTLYIDWSQNGTGVDSSVQHSLGDDDIGSHLIAPIARFMRVRVVNNSVAQGYLRLQTILLSTDRTARISLGETVTQYTDTLATRQVNDFDLDTSAGTIGGRSAVTVSGSNAAVAASSTEAVNPTGVFNWLTAATTVRIASGGNAADDASGAGAQTVLVTGLDENWAWTTVTLTTAGASASAAPAQTFIRVNKAEVVTCGTYSAANTGAITIENGGGGTTLLTIPVGAGKSSSAHYSVGSVHTAYMSKIGMNVDGAKYADITGYFRENADDVITPFTSAQQLFQVVTLTTTHQHKFRAMPEIPEKSDIWFTATTGSGNATSCSVHFDLILDHDLHI